MSLNVSAKQTKKKKKFVPPSLPKSINPFGAVDDDDNEEEDSENEGKRGKLSIGLGFSLIDDVQQPMSSADDRPTKRRKGRWDTVDTGEVRNPPPSTSSAIGDSLEKFMDKLQAGAMGNVVTQISESTGTELLSIDVGGSMMRVPKFKQSSVPQISGGVITPEELAKISQDSLSSTSKTARDPEALYTPSDWESDDHQGAGASDVSGKSRTDCILTACVMCCRILTSCFLLLLVSTKQAETEDEEEEKARRAFIEALKSASGPVDEAEQPAADEYEKPRLAAEVRSEKQRREQRMRELETAAQQARLSAEAAPDLGRLYNDAEGGVMEEAERNLDAAMAAPDALQVLAELNKKKELKAVDHSIVDYIPFKKNLYIVPRNLARLSSDEVADLRGKLKVKVRGHGAPAPISSFEQCGLSERILRVMEKQNITTPFPVQAQCLPCIMAGRDVIGIAKTGSGKTLAYLLPMLRHLMDQSPLAVGESGPIGLVLAPARELAYQIHLVCKTFTKQLGLK